MAAVRCDVFEHGSVSKPRYLIANAGELRGHLDGVGWKHVVANAVTPTFAVKEIDRRGYCLVNFSPDHEARAKRFYRP